MSIETKKPFMKRLTSEEIDDIVKRAGETDDQEEYDRLCRLLPIEPDLANTFKRYAGSSFGH